jgi:hypothetical protein
VEHRRKRQTTAADEPERLGPIHAAAVYRDPTGEEWVHNQQPFGVIVSVIVPNVTTAIEFGFTSEFSMESTQSSSLSAS